MEYSIHRIWYKEDLLGADQLCIAAVLMEDGEVADLALRDAKRSPRVLSIDVEEYLQKLGQDLREALRNDRLQELVAEALSSWSNHVQISDAEKLEAIDRSTAAAELARAVSE